MTAALVLALTIKIKQNYTHKSQWLGVHEGLQPFSKGKEREGSEMEVEENLGKDSNMLKIVQRRSLSKGD